PHNPRSIVIQFELVPFVPIYLKGGNYHGQTQTQNKTKVRAQEPERISTRRTKTPDPNSKGKHHLLRSQRQKTILEILIHALNIWRRNKIPKPANHQNATIHLQSKNINHYPTRCTTQVATGTLMNKER
ncbi:hypothetical protein VIGAN_01256400, partial [Vigna angularis var. angularis]